MFHFLLVRSARGHVLPSQACAAMTLTVLLACAAVQAQSTTGTVRADPQHPQASVPAVVYESSLTASKRPREEPAPSWRQANDTVTRIGGWRAYAREAQQPDASAAPAATPSTPVPGRAEMVLPAQHGHRSHKSMHNGHGAHPSPSRPTP
jgi:hypothetical protein